MTGRSRWWCRRGPRRRRSARRARPVGPMPPPGRARRGGSSWSRSADAPTSVVQEATRRRRMPALGRLLRRGRGRAPSRFRPACRPPRRRSRQGLMYGGPVDVPGFEFLDKRTGTYRWFPRPWDAAAVEAAHAGRGRASSAAAAPTGACSGAGPTTRSSPSPTSCGPMRFWGRVGVRALIVPCRGPGVAGREDVGRVGRGRSSAGSAARSGTSAWAGACASFRADAHAAPDRRLAARALHAGSDGRSLRGRAGPLRELRGLRRGGARSRPAAPGSAARRSGASTGASRASRASFAGSRSTRYDLFVLSDHGQIRSVPFRAVAGGVSVAEAIVGCFGPAREPTPAPEPPAAAAPPHRPMGPGATSLRRCRSGRSPAAWQREPRRHGASRARAERRVDRRALHRAGRTQRECVSDPHDGARAGGGDRGPLPGRARSRLSRHAASASSSPGMREDPCATIGARCSGSRRPRVPRAVPSSTDPIVTSSCGACRTSSTCRRAETSSSTDTTRTRAA